MQDVARAAGVSQSTVSRVLSGAPSPIPIATETRERVLGVAEDLGYQPNPLARGLRGARTMLLGIIVCDITDPFASGAIESLTVAAASHGYNVVLGSAHGRAREAIALKEVLETRHCDAIMLVGDSRDQPRLLAELTKTSLATVALWHGNRVRGMPSVSVNNQLGVYEALEYLVGLGHKRIAYVSGRPSGDIRERRDAYVRFMKAHDLAVLPGFDQRRQNDAQSGLAAIQELMALRKPPTAVATSTDIIAIGALHGAYAQGILVPQDLSVVGFDDLSVAAFTVPALTTIHMPVYEMAEIAVRVAIAQAAGAKAEMPAQQHVVAPYLVVRNSCGQVNAEDEPQVRGAHTS